MVALSIETPHREPPRRLEAGRTVCNVRNEKGKLCNGHLKQLPMGGEPAAAYLRGDDVLYKCQICGTLYMGPPLGHLRDPVKQKRFVQKELTEILRAAGGTLPFFTEAQKWRDKPATEASTSGTNSSPQADLHRPAAEAQAATGHASAAPLSPTAATASPVAGAETASELAPDEVSRQTEGAG